MNEKIGKVTGNKTENLSEEEKQFYEWVNGDCAATMSDVKPLSSGVSSSSVPAPAPEDDEVETTLRDAELDLSFTCAEASSTPSPSSMLQLLKMTTPTPSPLKRPPGALPQRPPPSKKQRGEDLQVQLLEEKLKYYKMKNELLEKQLLAVQETQQRDVECRLQSVERAIGLRE